MTPPDVVDGAAEPTLHVIGAGLIGTSIALAATRAGWIVTLEDADAGRAAYARSLVAREALTHGGTQPPAPSADLSDEPTAPPVAASRRPELVCVAVPPVLNGAVLLTALGQHLGSTVMDVCSVKTSCQAEVEASGYDLSRLVWSHPLAGAEGSGPEAARTDLFDGRTWIVCRPDLPAAAAVAGDPVLLARQLVDRLIVDSGARPLTMSAARHDELLAMTSHLPQLLSSALASEVVAAFAADDVDRSVVQVLPPSLLAGPGLLDMTRVAASPSELWAQIATMNRQPVRAGLGRLTERLQQLVTALDDPGTTATAVAALVDEGRSARTALDRKHAGATTGRAGLVPARDWTWVRATIADVPGTLARVFALAGELGVNIEDVQVDHAPYASQGLVSVAVRPADAERLARRLES